MAGKPDYHVHALLKNTDAKHRIGAAWKNADRTIAIILDSFIVLPGGRDLLITLFPNDGKKPKFTDRKDYGEDAYSDGTLKHNGERGDPRLDPDKD